MPNYTPNYNLELPLQTEYYDIAIFNSNNEIIDTALGNLQGSVNTLSNSVNAINNSINGINGTVIAGLNTRIINLETNVNALGNSVTNINASLTAVNGRLNNAVFQNQKGIPGGVASLDTNGQVPLSQLPNITVNIEQDLDTLNPISIGNNGGTTVGIGRGASENLGTYSTALGYSARARGTYTTALGYGATATASGSIVVSGDGLSVALGTNAIILGGNSLANGPSSIAIGYIANAAASYAISMGFSSRAAANNAIAVGAYANAGASSAIAIGDSSQATTSSSTAIGSFTVANGTAITAIGSRSNANGVYSTVIGWNCLTYNPSLTGSPAATSAVIIGSNCFTSKADSVVIGNGASVTNSQSFNEPGGIAIGNGATSHYGISIGSGANSTAAGLAIGRNVTTGTNGIGIGFDINSQSLNQIVIGGNMTLSAANAIMIGVPAFSNANGVAIGAGAASSGAANCVAVGACSRANSFGTTAVGYRANAPLDYSTAIGYNSVTSGAGGTVLGYAASANTNAVAVGNNARANGQGTVAIGANVTTGTNVSVVAIGYGANASATRAIAIGANSNASVYLGLSDTIAIGYGAKVGTANGIAIGTNAVQDLGVTSIAFGQATNASGQRTFALGVEAVTTTTGQVYFGNYTSVSGPTYTNRSDERDKIDIEHVDTAKSIDFLKALKPITYRMNPRERYKVEGEPTGNVGKIEGSYYDKDAHANGDKANSRRKIGVSAQQVKQALIDIYGTDDYGDFVYDNQYDERDKTDDENKLSVNYTAFVPVLIEVVKQQQEQIDDLLRWKTEVFGTNTSVSSKYYNPSN